MIDSKVVKLQIHTSKTDIIPLTNPILIRNEEIITRIGFYELGSINVRYDGGSFVLEDLTSFGVIPVVVAVEQVPDGGVRDLPDLCNIFSAWGTFMGSMTMTPSSVMMNMETANPVRNE